MAVVVLSLIRSNAVAGMRPPPPLPLHVTSINSMVGNVGCTCNPSLIGASRRLAFASYSRGKHLRTPRGLKSATFGRYQDRQSANVALRHNLFCTTDDNESTGSSNVFVETLMQTWRTDPSLVDVYHLPTLSVPVHLIDSILNGKEISPFLASSMRGLEGVHPRIKVVLDIPEAQQEPGDGQEEESFKRKLVLLSAHRKVPSDMRRELAKVGVRHGPSHTLLIPQKQQTPNRILQKMLPPEAQPPPTGYEQVGHVLHLNLKAHHYAYGRLIGDVLLERLRPSVRTVVTKIGEVKGPFRVYDMSILAGEPSTNVTLTEHGVTLKFDLAKVYWSTRLSGQRSRSIDEEFEFGEIIADAFCGVGALCVRAAVEKGCTVVGNDLNPDAVRSCEQNAVDNRVGDLVTATCGDAREFIANLGCGVAPLPHHLMLNFPLASTEFLSELREWGPIRGIDSNVANGDQNVIPTVHVYTFARGDVDNETRGDNKRDPATVAVDMVAIGLLGDPLPTIATSDSRGQGWAVLENLGCHVRAREVRDVAPGKVVIWVSFKVTEMLLSKMHNV